MVFHSVVKKLTTNRSKTSETSGVTRTRRKWGWRAPLSCAIAKIIIFYISVRLVCFLMDFHKQLRNYAQEKLFARLAYLTRDCTYTVNILWILEHSTWPTDRYVLYIRKLCGPACGWCRLSHNTAKHSPFCNLNLMDRQYTDIFKIHISNQFTVWHKVYTQKEFGI